MECHFGQRGKQAIEEKEKNNTPVKKIVIFICLLK
jgi:hypothetical protein